MDRRSLGRMRSARSRYLYVAVFVLALATTTITGFVWATKSVTVVVDGRATHYKTQAEDVRALLEQADVTAEPGDLVQPAPEAELRSGSTVVVRHSRPVTIVAGDVEVPVRVVGERVAEALVAAGLDPTAGLSVSPPLDTPLEAGMTIAVRDVFMRVAEQETAVPFSVRTVPDPALKRGVRRVVKPGVPGRRVRIYQVFVVNGSEGRRVLKSDRLAAAPVDEVVAVGGRGATLVSSPPGPTAKARVTPVSSAPKGGKRLKVEATAYAPGVGAGFITATGAKAGYGIVAVDPDVIPLGTRLYIPGYGYAVAADTGGAIDGARIDVCFETRAECIAWGRRTVTVIVLP